MNEDSKRAVLKEFLPEGEQYIVTIVGHVDKSTQENCYIGVTERSVVLAQVEPKQFNQAIRHEIIPFADIQSAKTHKNLLGWQDVTITTAEHTYQMVLKDNTLGTGLDKNLQLQGVKYLCQRLQEYK
ncbi:MAG: hypothetical protein K6A05_00690 [Lachnospiraceae bacterium]|nr:hypothetical protein [Lachnospiraceae bacterium]